jgi:hypothetical protein
MLLQVIIILIEEKLLDIIGEKIIMFGGEITQLIQIIQHTKTEILSCEKIENILYELSEIQMQLQTKLILCQLLLQTQILKNLFLQIQVL